MAEESVAIFIGALFPRVVRVREVAAKPGMALKQLVVLHFSAGTASRRLSKRRHGALRPPL
jgi:hypothetical protein